MKDAEESLESEIVQQMADDLGLTVNDTIGDLIEALQAEEAVENDEGDDGNT